jgi:hypothetical protein
MNDKDIIFVYRTIEAFFSNTWVVGIGASLLAMLIGYWFSNVFRNGRPRMANILFWRSFSADLVILISEVKHEYDPNVRIGGQPPLTPLGDALSLAKILNLYETPPPK